MRTGVRNGLPRRLRDRHAHRRRRPSGCGRACNWWQRPRRAGISCSFAPLLCRTSGLQRPLLYPRWQVLRPPSQRALQPCLPSTSRRPSSSWRWRLDRPRALTPATRTTPACIRAAAGTTRSCRCSGAAATACAPSSRLLCVPVALLQGAPCCRCHSLTRRRCPSASSRLARRHHSVILLCTCRTPYDRPGRLARFIARRTAVAGRMHRGSSVQGAVLLLRVRNKLSACHVGRVGRLLGPGTGTLRALYRHARLELDRVQRRCPGCSRPLNVVRS